MRKLIANLRNTLRNTFTTTSVKRIVAGYDNNPKESDLPQIQAYGVNTEIQLSGTAKDLQIHSVAIKGIVSVPKEMGQTKSQIETVSSLLTLYDLIEKKDSDGSINTASIVGVLRQDPTINNQEYFVQNINVNYDSANELGFPNAVATVTCDFVSRNLTK